MLAVLLVVCDQTVPQKTKKTSLEKKVSQRPLSTFQEEMTSALATMRVDYEQIKIKTIEDSSNPLLTKRRKKASSANPQSAAH